MRKRKREVWVHLIAVFWLLFAGICMDCSQAYPVLAWDDTSDLAVSLLRSSNRFTSEEICTSELLGHSTVVWEAKEREEYGENCRIRMRTVFLMPETISARPHLYYRTVSWSVNQESLNHAVIMNYIHNKDGRKPQSVQL